MGNSVTPNIDEDVEEYILMSAPFSTIQDTKTLKPKIDKIPVKLKKKENFWIGFVKLVPLSYYFIPSEFKENVETLFSFLSSGNMTLAAMETLKTAPEKFLTDRSLVVEGIKLNAYCILHVSEDLRNDEELVRMAMKNHKKSKMLKDTLFVLYSKKNQNILIHHLETNLKNKKQFISEFMKYDAAVYFSASEELQQDKELILQLLKKDGSCYSYLSDKFKNEKDFFLMSLSESSSNFVHRAPDHLKNDEDCILAAIKSDPSLICHRNYIQFKNEFKFMHQAVKYGLEVDSIPEVWYSNPEIMLWAIVKNTISFNLLSDDLKYNRDFIMELLELNPTVYLRLPDKFKNDKDLIHMLIRKGASIDLLPFRYSKSKETEWISKRYFKWIEDVPTFDLTLKFDNILIKTV